MAVYVDDMRASFGRMVMCHLLADTSEELLAMVDTIGVPRRWIQKHGTPQEHFDICMAKRAKAVSAGAQEITMRAMADIVRGKRGQRAQQQENEMHADPIQNEIEEKGLNAPRVTPADIEAEIASEFTFMASTGAQYGAVYGDASNLHKLDVLTICVLVLKNGFTVTGESACASPENFDAEIGRKIARQNAINKIWPLMGFRLRDKLSAG